MFAGVVHGRNDIRYEQIKTPLIKENEVLVKVKYTGICGSDVPRVNGDACHFYPNVLGHEFSGIIEQKGSLVRSVEIGDRVSGVPLVPCMKCDDCLNGDYSLCKNYSFIGSRKFGSFAEYVAVQESNVFKLDDSITFKQAAFFEPSTVALHGIYRTNFVPGKRVAVLGCGTIGLFLIQWARILGASHIVAINRSRSKLKIATAIGANEVVSTLDNDYIEHLLEIAGGKGYDYIFDATGNDQVIHDVFKLVANKGTVCMVGTPKKELKFSVKEWELINRKEFILTGSWMSYSKPFPGREWKETLDKFKSGELIITDAFIDREIGLSEIDKAFKLFKTPGTVKGKILINSEK